MALSTKSIKAEYTAKIARKCGYKLGTPSHKAMMKEFAKLRVPTLIILHNHMKGN